ncbi:MAG TPA: ABC transporter permease [Candidatus Saccharimonadales bacterium]|nr:ABC transporter permease [Candidatus Saccharimonadales bacterium]
MMIRTMRRLGKRLLFWTKAARDEERLRLEIAEHVALETEENIRNGMAAVEARRRAMVKFGGVETMKQTYRDTRGLPFLETLFADVRHALRRLQNAKAFTATTILTLALGIGATTSIFTLVHAVLLKSLAVSKPSELYRFGRQTHCCVWGGYTQYQEFSIFSDELYRHFRSNTPAFAELAAMQPGGGSLFGVRRANNPEPARSYPGKFVSGNYFAMFGIQPVAGRLLTNDDDNQSAAPVAVMSYRLWQQKYASDPHLVGSSFNLNDKPFTLVGIAPQGFYGDTLADSQPDFYIPLGTEPMVRGDTSLLRNSSANWLDIIGRVKPGTNATALEAQLRVELHQWMKLHWADMDDNARANEPNQNFYLSAGGAGITSMREQYEDWLKILMLVAGFVLLIVCANVANLMLARGIARRQQISLSIALGASPGRLVRQALTESVVLSLFGGLAGLAVAYAGTKGILHFAFTPLAGLAPTPIDAAPSMAVLLFAFGVSLLTGVVFGIVPAWMTTRVDPIEALRGANRATGKSGSLPRKTLVVLQAALSLSLLCASGLLTLALGNLEHQNFGFEQERRVSVHFDPQLAGYRADQLPTLYRRVHDVFAGLPGVEMAAVCSYSPLSGDSWNDGIFVNGHPAPGPTEDSGSGFERVGPRFLSVIGNPILRGREFTEQDVDSAPHVAVVNEAFVKKFFPHEEPLGKHVGRSEIGASRLYEIVGIAKDARISPNDMAEPIGAFMFLPEAQYDVFPTERYTQGDVRSHYLYEIVLKLKPGARLTLGDASEAMATVDPNLPIFQFQTLRQQVAHQFDQQRLIARLTSLFGILSLLLASIGLYGVTAYNVGQRTNEIGLRMALGANRGNVLSLVMRGALGLIGVGLVLGIPLSLWAGRFLQSQLFGTKPFSWTITLTSLAALGVAGFVAALIPALRASSIEPLQALRME